MLYDQDTHGVAFRAMREMNSPWRSMLHLASRHALPKGHEIFLEDALYFLERGKGRLTQQNPELREKIFWYIEEGCLFGEVPYFEPKKKIGYIYFFCSSDSIVYSFSQKSLNIIQIERPDLYINLIESMAHKMRVLTQQLASLYLDNLLVRTCKFIAQRIAPKSMPLKANIAISRQEMASILGVNRISLYKILHTLEKDGILGPIIENTVTILQPEKFFSLIQN